MKTLILVRHAKSDWEDSSLHDIERPLADRGLRDANTMGDLMAEKMIKPDIMISSPALRAFSTCRIFCDKMAYDKNNITVETLLYFGNIPDIIKMLQSQKPDLNTVCIFGHNPTFSILAETLCRDFAAELPTCAIVAIQWEINRWGLLEPGNGKLLWYEYPKKNR